jgi:hypothetical protein
MRNSIGREVDDDDYLVLTVMCLGTTHFIRFRLSNEITFGWIASEALRLHFLAKCDLNAWKSNRFCVIGIMSAEIGRIDLSEVYSRRLYARLISRSFTVLIEGPFSLLTPHNLRSIILYCCPTPRDVQTLMNCSKRLLKECKKDEVWETFDLSTKWTGSGRDGNESAEWEHVRNLMGIPVMNTLRLSSYQSVRTPLANV